VLVLNPITAAMLEPYARRVCVVPWGIDAARFPWGVEEEGKDGDTGQAQNCPTFFFIKSSLALWPRFDHDSLSWQEGNPHSRGQARGKTAEAQAHGNSARRQGIADLARARPARVAARHAPPSRGAAPR